MKAKGWESQHKIPPQFSHPISFKKSKFKSKSNPKSVSNPQLPTYFNPEFTDRRHWSINTTTLYSVSSAAADSTWPYAAVDGAPQLLHPLTFDPHLYTLPVNLELFTSKTKRLTSLDHTSYPFSKLVIPPPTVDGGAMVVLHGGGDLVGCLPVVAGKTRLDWVRLSRKKFDDVNVFKWMTYAVDRQGRLYRIINNVAPRDLRLGEEVISEPIITPETGQVGWRKRLVLEGGELYLVVRVEEKVFRVYVYNGSSPGGWDDDVDFEGVVLFVSEDFCFFMDGFGGSEYKDCIVFSEGAFPKYGSDGGWEFCDEDGLGVFRLTDERYGRVGESLDFPKIDWSPPSWIFDVGESDEDDEGDTSLQEDEEMQSNVNIEGDTSLQEDVPPSLFAAVSAVEQEVTRTLLRMNGGNEPMEKESSMRTATLSPPGACTSSTAKGYEGESATAKFEGFDVRADLVPILQKIWRNHGNMIENSTIRNSDIVARALESLATVVRILENNSVESLSDCQADYLNSTLSDLKVMCFNVDWLSSIVEKAVKLCKNKALVDSLNKLSQLSSQIKESRAIFLDKVAKLTKEENKLKKEMTKVSKLIPFSKQVKFDEPFGSGLT